MKVLIAAGGTGGHIYPGISIAEKLKEKDVEAIFLGTKWGMESRIIPMHNFRLFSIATGQFSGKNMFVKIRTLAKVIKGIVQTVTIIKKEKPSCVIGMGGFVSFPAILSAILMNVPSFLHEQNVTMGLTNRILHRFVKKVFLSFEETAKLHGLKNYLHTGNPVRKTVKESNVKKDDGFGLFVFGGSRGARRINKAIIDLLPTLSRYEGIRIYHQTGEQDYEEIKSAYSNFLVSAELFPFTHEIGRYYCLADLVISRAGSSTIFELACKKKPAILVPYPYSAGKHQLKNALYVEKIGGAIVLKEDELTERRIIEVLEDLKDDKERLSLMGENMGKIYVENSEEKIANEILRYVK